MSLAEAISRRGNMPSTATPEYALVQAAVRRVRERWPDVDTAPEERDRDVLARRLKEHLDRGDWSDVRLGFVRSASMAVFDDERGDRPDLDEARSFLVAETRQSEQPSFLSGMAAAYLETFRTGHSNARALADALKEALPRMSGSWRTLFEAYPQFLDSEEGPSALAWVLIERSLLSGTKDDPFLGPVEAGLRDPRAPGFMEQTHRSMIDLARPHLGDPEAIEWYMRWLHPSGEGANRIDAAVAIEALISPWLNDAPPDGIRAGLVEKLVEKHGDPRLRSGGTWARVASGCMRAMHRWLTREDMRFFADAVDSIQKDPMWSQRRDFWLNLCDEGAVDAAWTALSGSAAAYAREHLRRDGGADFDVRFGRQIAEGSCAGISLLILEIGNKVFVDGSHNYMTHAFLRDDPDAPKLYRAEYDCEAIAAISPESQSHGGIQGWSIWVREMMDAEVAAQPEFHG